MKVRVLGPGCANCKATARLIEEVAASMGVDVTVEKVEDMGEIVAYGVMATPGVVVGDEVVHAGGRPSRDKVAGWLGG